jgi:hypothetical protein
MTTITLDGKTYSVKYITNPNRVIIDFDGLFVLADLVGSSWQFSGVPASLEEGKIIQELCAPMNDKTIVTIEKI